MSILIKGMKMPKDCLSCRWHHRTGVCVLTGMVTNTGKDCPLVPVPTPHGRLIDCETLKDDIAVLLERNKKLIDEWLAYAIDDVIDEVPTIIEAEEGETNKE